LESQIPVADVRNSEDSYNMATALETTTLSLDSGPAPPPKYNNDDIKTEFHPSSQLSDKINSFSTYNTKKLAFDYAEAGIPCAPFHSQAEFEFAEIALEAALSNTHLDQLIKVVHILMKASTTLTSLVSEFTWDAQRLSKFNSENNEGIRFINEPWTADEMWKIQSFFPPDGKPLGLIIYADKNKLSSFGTVKGYPVMASIANLPSEIRHRTGIGATRVVGWLPILDEEAYKNNPTAAADHKQIIWHKSFKVLLQTIKLHSQTGCWFKCGNNIIRHIFPFVLILSADFEEQSVMAITRGGNANFSCPICLMFQITIKSAQDAFTKTAAENILKAVSLRSI
ncbi:hypothetical protein AX16_008766, partial [Volvariella volvacea WC 439]